MKNLSLRGMSLAFRYLSILVCVLAFAPGTFSSARAQVANATTVQMAAATVLGFQVSGRSVLDANGDNFIMRGINVPHNWYPEQTSQFQHAKAKGANTVRVVLSSGHLWPKNSASDVANVISLCKTNKLICVLEVHDTTGYGESAASISLAQAVTYWKEIKSVLIGQEAYVIINIGNEPYGNVNATGWINDTKNAIAEMRSAGFQHMLMVDAPDWGQDWEFIMRDNAASVFNSDPNRNILFSIHMYGIFNTASKIQSYLSTFVNAGLPIVVGEFGHEHSDGNPDEDSILSITQANGIGYLGWMWSGGSGAGTLDMVTDFDPNQETWWGTRIIQGPNGIATTSQEASVYSGISPTRYTISGNVETRGITLSTDDDTIETVVSDANGNYSITVPSGWSGTVSPSHPCFTFLLPSRTYTNVNTDIPNQNYTPGFNPSSGCAEVAVTIASNSMAIFALPPGTSLREGYAGVNNGPAKINSTNFVDVLTALRVIWNEPGSRFSYSEMMGLPSEHLSQEYWFPWYNNAVTNSMDQGLRIANVNTVSDNTVEVWVGDSKLDTITLAPGASVRVNYNVDNGPLRVSCTTCSTALYDQIITTLRVIWTEPGFRSSYSEMFGLPREQLSNEYWFPWYNNADRNSMDQGFRIANISPSEENTVEVRMGNTVLDTIILNAGGSIRVGYNVNNGPIQIVCTTCSNTGSDKIIAALRVIWTEPGFRSSYSEMMGLPKEQLSNEYWFPWYNNAVSNSMDQGFRIANVDLNADNTVEVWVGSTKLQTISLTAGGSTRVGYNVDNGPVRIICTTCSNTGNDKIIAALRVIWTEPGFRSSYSEMMGLPKEQLSEEYWFPWYNNADINSMDQGFRIAVP